MPCSARINPLGRLDVYIHIEVTRTVQSIRCQNRKSGAYGRLHTYIQTVADSWHVFVQALRSPRRSVVQAYKEKLSRATASTKSRSNTGIPSEPLQEVDLQERTRSYHFNCSWGLTGYRFPTHTVPWLHLALVFLFLCCCLAIALLLHYPCNDMT
jgi:hypothetical protein